MTTLSMPDLNLPRIPRDEDGPVFGEPWEAQAFALAVKLSDEGHFTWKEWAAALADELKTAADRGEPDDGTRYYRHWLAALERLVTEKGLVDSSALLERKEAWADAYRHTPNSTTASITGTRSASGRSVWQRFPTCSRCRLRMFRFSASIWPARFLPCVHSATTLITGGYISTRTGPFARLSVKRVIQFPSSIMPCEAPPRIRSREERHRNELRIAFFGIAPFPGCSGPRSIDRLN
jgi:nitrile hydratase accessory protein